MNILFQPVSELLNLNDNARKALDRLGINIIRDLLFYLPHSWQTKLLSPNLSDLSTGQLIQADILIKDIALPNTRRGPIKILVGNETGDILLVFFNKIPPFIFQKLRIGSKHIISGKVQFFDGLAQINHPEFILRKELEMPLEPIYSLTYSLMNKQLYYYICKAFEIVDTVLEHTNSELKQYLANIITQLKILHLYHFKQNPNQIIQKWQNARKILAEHELISNQLSLKIVRSSRNIKTGQSFKKATELQQKILYKLGFKLTEGQEQVIAEIEKDQQAPVQMMRLLQGDVGSGKTLVALMTMLNVVQTGSQTVLMAPTDLLANQHYQFFTNSLQDYNIKISLLTGKTSAKERRQIATELETGDIKILIGTHALFQENVAFKELAYVVIDEQHKFGVEQRLKLINKSSHPDLLVMTATPIPRSLTLTMYGDMDVSSLKSKPKNRLPIITSVTSNKNIPEVIAALKRKITLGEKIYWVCPLIESAEITENAIALKDVLTRFEMLKAQYPEMVSIMHGKMKPYEKDAVMQEFKSGKIQIMVSTTVIEVGIDVPDATSIVIENAEQFGLAQLHQLRGRVGRGNKQSYCILIYNPARFSQHARTRLSIMRTSNDGFYIAQQDMLLRGSGEMLGAKQSGEPEFFFANLKDDIEVLVKASKIVSLMNVAPIIDFQIRLFARRQHASHINSG